jgi:hypothetical protein
LKTTPTTPLFFPSINPAFSGTSPAKKWRMLKNPSFLSLRSHNFKKADTIYFFFISAQGAETTTQNSR